MLKCPTAGGGRNNTVVRNYFDRCELGIDIGERNAPTYSNPVNGSFTQGHSPAEGLPGGIVSALHIDDPDSPWGKAYGPGSARPFNWTYLWDGPAFDHVSDNIFCECKQATDEVAMAKGYAERTGRAGLSTAQTIALLKQTITNNTERCPQPAPLKTDDANRTVIWHGIDGGDGSANRTDLCPNSWVCDGSAEAHPFDSLGFHRWRVQLASELCRDNDDTEAEPGNAIYNCSAVRVTIPWRRRSTPPLSSPVAVRDTDGQALSFLELDRTAEHLELVISRQYVLSASRPDRVRQLTPTEALVYILPFTFIVDPYRYGDGMKAVSYAPKHE